MKILTLSAIATLALMSLSAPASAQPGCDVMFDACVEANTEGACVLAWVATHAVGPCVDYDDPRGTVQCTLANQCVDHPDDCDKNSDVCVTGSSDGACALVWAVYHPLGACADISHDPAVAYCTFSSCTRVI